MQKARKYACNCMATGPWLVIHLSINFMCTFDNWKWKNNTEVLLVRGSIDLFLTQKGREAVSICFKKDYCDRYLRWRFIFFSIVLHYCNSIQETECIFKIQTGIHESGWGEVTYSEHCMGNVGTHESWTGDDLFKSTLDLMDNQESTYLIQNNSNNM